jgi:DNA modification methylase
MIKPFSILDTRTKEWQDRKRWWTNTYKIKSELGREGTISKSKFWDIEETNVSIFDATLCEYMYKWFTPKEGKILDPFAGGSVRGIVATEMGFQYNGIDLSEEQVKANRLQSTKPIWMIGDSDVVLNSLNDEQYDFVFTCPPYYDLEKYSETQNDLSNMSDDEFDSKYLSILSKSAEKLKENRFFVVVVSEVREVSKTGNYKIGKYRGLVHKTIQNLENSGLHFYNDMVLFNSQHQAGRVVDTYFKRNRKIASVHQNVLVFVKGNPDLATEDIEWDGTYRCKVDGMQFKSFREAAISLNPNELVASEVERRCKSPKTKYKGWQIVGEETNPILKYSIDGYYFESPVQAALYLSYSETEIRNCLESKAEYYSHWKKLENPIIDWTYEEHAETLKDCSVRDKVHTISCDDLMFYSMKEAAEYFKCSDERIRQKLQSPKHPNYFYLFTKK